MFTTVRYFVKASILFLLVGIVSGLYLMLAKFYKLPGYSTETISAHAHLILLGSVMMMIMGVALWFFPRAEKTDKKYKPDLIRFIFWIFSVSTALRFIVQFLYGFLYLQWLTFFITATAVFQVLSIILFFYSIWGRIRPVGSQIREKKGEKF